MGINSLLNKYNIKSEIFTFAEFYTIIMSFIYLILIFVFGGSIDDKLTPILINLSVIIGIVLIARFTFPYLENKNVYLLKKIYIAPLLWVVYSQIHIFIPIVNPHDYDTLLIEVDRALFGMDITKVLYNIANPVLTEFLQFCYMLHFFLPIIIGIDLILTDKRKDLAAYANLIAFGFYFSYIMYFFLPAIGPRFTLHDFNSINTELPGLWLTNFFRDAVNAGGAIPPGTPNPEIAVNRDCMPSGHTMIALMNIILAFRYKVRMRYVVLVLGSGLIFSTLYMRYHYLIDVIAGIASAMVVFWIEPKVRNWFKNKGYKQI
ncbi:MAG: phosphatase PAP2 family protein [Candidatus Kapaibacteriota bacterium]|jgi:membrane-associated phospholipid phosphatase